MTDDGAGEAGEDGTGADAGDPTPETAAETAERGVPGAADPQVPAPDGDADRTFAPDPEKRRVLREAAAEVRGESGESRQVAAFLYRVSDLYDPAEDTSPEEIYLNVRTIVRVKASGGLER
jgi:hypothetical protein